MSLPNGAEAQNEAQATFRCVRLVGMRHDTGIEQSRGFERILTEKIGADQLALNFGKGAVSRKSIFHFVGARLERLQQVAMPALEILQNIRHLVSSGFGTECENAVD